MVLGLMSVCTAWMYGALKTGKIILFLSQKRFVGHLFQLQTTFNRANTIVRTEIQPTLLVSFYNFTQISYFIRYKKKPKLVASVPVMAGVSAVQTPCYCNGTPEQGLDEFEGSAILHHGSRLKFGCLEFVFTVAAS